MSRTDTNVYGVKKLQLMPIKQLWRDDVPFYIRDIIITTKDDSEVNITVFADDDRNLFLAD